MDFTLLKNIGIDTDKAVERFVGNAALYSKMLKKFIDDGTFEKLVKAVSAHSNTEAFEASHTLKGLCGNLSIDRLFKLFSEQVVLMRTDKWNEAYDMMTEITQTYNETLDVLKTWFDMN